MESRLTQIPAHLVSLTGEYVVRMRVDPSADRPLAAPVRVAPGEKRPLATVDIASLRASIQVGVTPY